MPWNNEPNILNHEVIFFKGSHLENALRISALTPLTCEHGIVNDELMFWFFAYYQTYGPQQAFVECHIANSFTWQHLTNHVLEHGTTEASLKAFVEKRLQCGITEASQFNTLIVPINDSQHWSLMILEREKYYHMNSKPDYNAHNNSEMKTLFAKCWEIMQGNYDEDMVDAPNHQRKHNKWVQTNVPTQKGSWECGWFVFKYFVMYLEQRFVEPKREGLELVSNTLCTTSFTGVYRLFVAS
jgi:Ulp1 family protease